MLISLLAINFHTADGQAPEVRLELVASGLTSPVALAAAPDDSGRLFVADQAGQVRIIDADGNLLSEPFLDVTDRMVTLQTDFDERGLLGLAFHPQYTTNGLFYVYYSAPLRSGGPSGWDHTSHVSEFSVSANDANRADPGSERILLQVDQPQFNHNAGAIAFGPDGYLYIALGDGGGANDNQMGHVSDWYAANGGGNGQDVTDNLLGSILRIDVDDGDPYGIPDDNPFVGRDGMDEIYAYGFRNPYRFSFDRGGTNMLLVADVGQHRWEEVNTVARGGNYGWNVYEGAHCFDAENPEEDLAECPDVVGAGHPDEGASLIGPVIEYASAHLGGPGIAVVGGYIYRGSDMPEMVGQYIFGDWSTDFSAPDGTLLIATPQDEGMWAQSELQVVDGEFQHFLLAIGEDSDGELYVLTTNSGGPTGTTGRVYKMASAGNVAAESGAEQPDGFALFQNYPNPFNPSTNIRFRTEKTGQVTLAVYDALGRRVRTLVDSVFSPGEHAATWDGRNSAGQAVPSGVYMYRISTASGSAARAMTLLR